MLVLLCKDKIYTILILYFCHRDFKNKKRFFQELIDQKKERSETEERYKKKKKKVKTKNKQLYIIL